VIPKINQKELVASIIFSVILFVMFSVIGGWPGTALATVIVIYGIWLDNYERSHPEASPTEADRETVLKLLDQFASLGTLRAMRQCVSPWQRMGRIILLPLLWHMMIFRASLRSLLCFSDWLRS